MTAPVQTDDDQGWTPWQLRRRQAGPMWGVLLVSILSILFIFGCAGSSLLLRLPLAAVSWGVTPHCGVWASLAVEHRLNSCATQALLLQGMRDLPGPGIEPMSPALTGEFFTTGPPRKPRVVVLDLSI